MEICVDRRKNKLTIGYEGYTYVKDFTGEEIIVWRCISRGTECQGALFTNMFMDDPQVAHLHNHPEPVRRRSSQDRIIKWLHHKKDRTVMFNAPSGLTKKTQAQIKSEDISHTSF